MRVALVQAPAWGALPPLGPCSLKAYLQEHGHEATCFDFNIDFFNEFHAAREAHQQNGGTYGGPDPWGADSYGQWALDYDCFLDEIRFQEGSIYNDEPLPLRRWAETVLEGSPGIVGFTTYLTSSAASMLLAKEIKDLDPSVVTVFGGPNSARDREGIIPLLTGHADVVVDGEGEAAIVDLADAIERGDEVGRVAGIGLLVDGDVVWTEARKQIKKIDTLPFPDFGDIDWESYPDPLLVPIMSNRGCTLNCAFCYETVYWRRFRMQSGSRIVDEIEHQIEHHPLRDHVANSHDRFYFMFADSLVNGNLHNLLRMCDELDKRGIEIGWGGQSTIDKRMDDEVCARLAASGCTGLAVGLESGSQRVLEKMGKKFHIDDAAGVLKAMYDAGLPPTVNVMVGFPTETKRDFLATIRFLYKTRKWLAQVSNVTTTQVALGSEMHTNPDAFGITIDPDGSWTSPQTGHERHRRRRLAVLHFAMKVLKIPHQNIAPD